VLLVVVVLLWLGLWDDGHLEMFFNGGSITTFLFGLSQLIFFVDQQDEMMPFELR
jgi:hypothetical protein